MKPKQRTNRCIECGIRMTWANQRAQYDRLRNRGMNHEEAASHLPRCQKCLTRHLKEIGDLFKNG